MYRRFRFAVIYTLYCCVTCAVMLAFVEAALRLTTDRPLGLFDATPLNHTSLYHPSSRIPMELMAIPYVIDTNSLGFRGPEITKEKPPECTRILALGDSITDGYLVDNPDTYPVRLEELLRAEGRQVEVVNAARGGSTIDREYWILRHYGAPLSPDVVVLTFVGNDIYEMGNRNVEALLGFDPEPLDLPRRAALWSARSATGEWLLDRYFSARFAGYRGHGTAGPTTWGPERYVVPGGTDYEAILPVAREKLQGLKMHLPTLEPAIQERVDVYLAVLEHMHGWCAARGIQLVWAWFPTFVQSYGDSPNEPIYDYLPQRVAEVGIPVLDLVPSFRRADRSTPLYLAPVDYHLTPTGNRLLAQSIRNGLVDHGILPSINKEVE